MDKKKYIKFIIVNLITLSRVVGSIVLPIVYFTRGLGRLGLFVAIIFLTDFVDGKLSRYWKVESFLGSLLDGISDKLFAFVMLAILSYEYPLMLLVILFEFVIFVVNMLAFKENKNIQSSKLGKVKTFVLDVVICIMFMFVVKETYIDYLPLRISEFIINIEYSLSYILIGVIIGMQIVTISDYSKKRLKQANFEHLKGKKLKSYKEIWELLTNRDFYIKNKNERLKDFLYKEKGE